MIIPKTKHIFPSIPPRDSINKSIAAPTIAIKLTMPGNGIKVYKLLFNKTMPNRTAIIFFMSILIASFCSFDK